MFIIKKIPDQEFLKIFKLPRKFKKYLKKTGQYEKYINCKLEIYSDKLSNRINQTLTCDLRSYELFLEMQLTSTKE